VKWKENWQKIYKNKIDIKLFSRDHDKNFETHEPC
jgi:hypothetical protein